MANCKTCNEPIFFAWHAAWLRWLPCELSSIRDDDVEHGAGLLYGDHHMRHRCGLKPHRDSSWKSPWSRQQHPEPQSEPEVVATGVLPRSLGGKTPHATLYVMYDAPIEVIQAAYRALAKLHHPDFGGDPTRMMEINRAYAALVQKNEIR